ncbi:hypothetical protein AAG906_006150 [Vitis piasezkii]
MWVLSVLPIKGLLGVISLPHNFPRLIILIHLNNIGRGHLGTERPPVSFTATGHPCYAAQFTARPTTAYPKPRAQHTSAPFALRT